LRRIEIKKRADKPDNPSIEINVVDPFVRKGYRFKGVATVHSNDDVYAEALSLLAERGYQTAPNRIAHIVLVDVRKASQLISPAYDAGASEDEVRARWLRHFDALNSGDPASTPDAPRNRRGHANSRGRIDR
jgi:hypothetical protein